MIPRIRNHLRLYPASDTKAFSIISDFILRPSIITMQRPLFNCLLNHPTGAGRLTRVMKLSIMPANERFLSLAISCT